MPWDDDKDTGDELTSDEWDNHVTDQKNHSTRHENGGTDELDVSGLSGVLADPQDPQTEVVQDIVGALITSGGNITTTYDDGNDVLTVDTSALNEEQVEDAVGALVTAGNAITVNYDDANDELSIAVDESSLSFYDGTNLTAPINNQLVTTEGLDVETSSETYTLEQDGSGNLFLRNGTAGDFIKFTQGGATEYKQVMRVDDELVPRNAVNFANTTSFVFGDTARQQTAQDVRNISTPSRGTVAYHDGSGTNTEGPAFYNGTDWISTVDGSTIA